MPEKYLVDLLSAGPDVIARMPRPLIHQGLHSGRVILSEDDPNFTFLLLLGCDYTRILVDSDLDKPLI